MLKDIKGKIDLLLEKNEYSIGEIDYGRLKAYIDLLYFFVSLSCKPQKSIEEFKNYIQN